MADGLTVESQRHGKPSIASANKRDNQKSSLVGPTCLDVATANAVPGTGAKAQSCKIKP
jgi:hypothetical protein